MVIGIIFFAAGTGLMGLAASQAAIGMLFAYLGGGIGISGGGLVLLNWGLGRWLEEGEPHDSHHRQSRSVMAGLTLICVGVGLVSVGIAWVRADVLAAGAAVVVVGMIPIEFWAAPKLDRLAGFWLSVGGLLVLVGALLVGYGDQVNTAIGVVLWLGGLVGIRAGSPRYLVRLDGSSASVVAAVYASVVLFVLVAMSWHDSVGGLFAMTTLGLVGACLGWLGIRHGQSVTLPGIGVIRLGPIVLAIAGFVVLAIASVWLVAVTTHLALALAVMVLAGSVSGWTILRGEHLVVALLIGFVLTWAAVDRVESEPTPGFAPDGGGWFDAGEVASGILAPKLESGKGWVAVVGDSFVSGEGIGWYQDGTNEASSNECRRSHRSFPALLVEHLEDIDAVVSAACSGARLDTMLFTAQYERSRTDVAGGLSQFTTISMAASQIGEPALVVISVGGNDVGFAGLVKACLLPQTCDSAATVDDIEDATRRLQDGLHTAYSVFADRFSRSEIVVVGYPQLTHQQGQANQCPSTLERREQDFVTGVITKLNNAVRQAAHDAGVTYIDIADTLVDKGQSVCGDEPGVHWISLAPPGGNLLDRLDPSGWAHQTMHPNVRGHASIAAEVADKVGSVRVPPANLVVPTVFPVPIEEAATDTVEQAGTMRSSYKGWISAALADLAENAALPIIVAMFGGTLVALAVVRSHDSRYGHWLAAGLGDIRVKTYMDNPAPTDSEAETS